MTEKNVARIEFKMMDKKHPLAGYTMKDFYTKDGNTHIQAGLTGVLLDANCLDIRTLDEMKYFIDTITKAWWYHEHLENKHRVDSE